MRCLSGLAVLLLLAAPALRGQDRAHMPFKGVYRAGPKTTMLNREPKQMASIAALRASFPPDQVMRAKYSDPDIAAYNPDPAWQAKYNVRLPEENRVVTVHALLFAAKPETGRTGDNDFHLIIGDSPNPRELMNVEVSGVPKADPDPFILVRKQLIAMLAPEGSLRSGRFRKYDPPIPVEVTGSLYFDADHAAGAIGPRGLQPSTVWEIHPVHSIRRLAKAPSVSPAAPGAPRSSRRSGRD